MPSNILSDNGVISGTSGIKTTGSNDGQLTLQTTSPSGTAVTALTINNSQVVTLAQPLPVASGGTGSASGVNLATSVTGTLPIANGGTGTTSTTFVNLATNVTGTLPTANGGTGVTAVGTAGNVLTSNGTAWVSQAIAAGGANIQSFAVGGTYTKPPGAKFVMVEMWGAGGGGGSSVPGDAANGRGGAGGGGGGYIYKTFAAPEVGATVTVTIGAGGPGASPSPSESNTYGGNGGTTNFGTLLYAYGGYGGRISNGGQGGGMYTEPSPSPVGFNEQALFSPTSGFRSLLFNVRSSGAWQGSIAAGIWTGGSGGVGPNPSSIPTALNGGVSVFGGGGGGGGGVGAPGPASQDAGKGGLGRMYGAPPSNSQTSVELQSNPSIGGIIGGGGGVGGTPSPRNGGTGNNFNGGGGGGGAVSNPGPGAPGGTGGLAAGGGGGGGGAITGGTAGVSGAGGNGYVLVYTWS